MSITNSLSGRLSTGFKLTLAGTLMLTLAACGGSSGGGGKKSSSANNVSSLASSLSSAGVSSSSSSTVESSSSNSSSSSSAISVPAGLLQTNGTQWVDDEGNQILLKGTNLGNWLVQEFWMMGQGGNGVKDQCTLEAELTERFGYAEKERLIKLFRDNWIKERDALAHSVECD
jgi:endoglucanase